jgi:coatomer subunit delta
MVVLGAAVTTKAGKVLLSRQYRRISRIRIEGLLAAFPKLIGTDVQHTYVETDNVRYVYQPVESLYVLLITTKNSNIVEDLETLRLLGKILPEYTPRYGTVDEESIMEAAFEIIYSFDEVIDWGGLRENVDLQQIATFTEMYSHEERLVKMIQESKMQEAKEERKRKEQEIRKMRADAPGGNPSDPLSNIGHGIGRMLQEHGMANIAADLGFAGGQNRAKANLAYAAAGGISSDTYLQQQQQQMMMGGGGGLGGGMGAMAMGSNMVMGGGGMGVGGGGMGMGMGTGMGRGSSGGSYGQPVGTVPVAAGAGRKGMTLGGKSRKSESLIDSLRAEGEVVDERPAMTAAAARGPAAAAAAAAAASSAAPAKPVQLSSVEKLTLTVNRDGGVQSLEVKGDLLLHIADPSKAVVRIAVTTGDAEARGFQFRTHPNVDRTLFATQHLIGLKDPTKPFPAANISSSPLAVLRWRYVSKEESACPLLINCWPSETGSLSQVNIEYELGDCPPCKELQNVIISIPLGSGASQPTVSNCDGEFVYNVRAHCVEWRLAIIDHSNRTGSLEFTTGAMDASAFFPVTVRFASKHTYAQVHVNGVAETSSGIPVDYSYDASLVPESFSIV